MRPARKGPENLSRARAMKTRDTLSFNEAGPQGAGKPVRGVAMLRGWVIPLQ